MILSLSIMFLSCQSYPSYQLSTLSRHYELLHIIKIPAQLYIRNVNFFTSSVFIMTLVGRKFVASLDMDTLFRTLRGKTTLGGF